MEHEWRNSMELIKYEGKFVKILTKNGESYSGKAIDYTPAEDNVPEKDSICIGEIEFFESDIKSIEMFSYTISKTADNTVFREACKSIEKHIGCDKETLIEDVDGSQIQIYSTADGEIKVYNDYEVDAVYIDSEINLENLF